MAGDRGKVDFLSKSSLPLQIFLFFNQVWAFLWFLIMLGVFIWKGAALPYPDGRLGPEFLLIFACLFVEITRLFIGSKGNKTENHMLVIAFLILSFFTVLANIYFIEFQIYVMRIDQIINIISIIFVGLELLLSIIAIIRFVSQS